MATTRMVTVDELLAMPKVGRRYELIAGELRELPIAGGEHGQIETNLIYALYGNERIRQAGMIFPGDTGVFFGHDPEIVLFPDVTFIRSERLPPPAERVGFLDVIPDLVAEIISPSERPGDVKAKVEFYLAQGVSLVWVVYPSREVVVSHRQGQAPSAVAVGDELVADDLFTGYRLPVTDIFR